MTAAQFTVDRLYTKDLYVNGAQINHPSLAALLTNHPSNNVGIGTNDPKVRLDISGTNALRLPAGNKTTDRPDVADSDYCIRYNTTDNIFEGYSNGNWGSLGGVTSINQKVTITADNTDGLQFYTDDGGDPGKTERMTILNNGNVGIGKTNPGYTLEVNGIIASRDKIIISKPSVPSDNTFPSSIGKDPNDIYLQIGKGEYASNAYRLIGFGWSDYRTVDAWIGTISKSTTQSEHSDIVFGTASNTGWEDDPTEKMRITTDGKVGIGTDNPKVILDISGTNALRLPAGNKIAAADGGDRPADADANYCIRYNTTDNIFEGYSNGNWGSLGGVTSINQKVTITADNTDGLKFLTGPDGGNSLERMSILNDGTVNIGSINDIETYINDISDNVDTQITNLIGGAPGALDTLNELAAALGDDANYATTVTNSLALKAPLASPSFTGNITLASNGRIIINSSLPNIIIQGSSGPAANITAQNNIIMGEETAHDITSGSNNNIFGYQAAKKITTGYRNNIFGYQAGNNMTSGSYNNIMGYRAARVGNMTGAAHNNIMGTNAGEQLTTGAYNNIMGYRAAYAGIMTHLNGCNNIFGREAGYNTTTGQYSNMMGYQAGYKTTTGLHGIFLGMQAGYYIVTGNNNIAIGKNSGPTQDRSNTICIGADVSVDGDNMCRIGNDDMKVGIGTSSPGEKLTVNGSIQISGSSSSTVTNESKIIFTRNVTDTDESENIAKIYTGNNVGPLVLESGRGNGYVKAVGNSADSDPIFIATHFVYGERFRICGNGNVGIGINSPDAKLHVAGDILLWEGGNSWTTGAYSKIIGDNAGARKAIWWNYDNSPSGTQIRDNHSVGFYTGGNTGTDHSIRMLINSDGNVGIGTTSPGAGLHVTKTKTGAPGTAGYLSKNGGVSTGDYGNSRAIAIRTENGHIWSSGAYSILVTSDIRIKENIVEVNDDLALQKIRDISCCWYNYKDKVLKGNYRALGFIAQQVKEHLPEAISIQKDIIPDEMKQIHTSWNETKMSSNDLQDVSGVKYRFYVSNDISGNEEKMVELVGDENNCFTFEEKWENIFCYGKEVDDFHTLDKQKLFAINFSATQEIDRIQQAEKAKLAAAETKLAAAETEITTLKTQLAAVLARLDALENA